MGKARDREGAKERERERERARERARERVTDRARESEREIDRERERERQRGTPARACGVCVTRTCPSSPCFAVWGLGFGTWV